MKTKTFRIASENKTEISLELIGKNFEELDPCCSEFEENSKIFIDVEKKTFYFMDDECFISTKGIIAHKFNATCVPIDLKEIQNLN